MLIRSQTGNKEKLGKIAIFRKEKLKVMGQLKNDVIIAFKAFMGQYGTVVYDLLSHEKRSGTSWFTSFMGQWDSELGV